MNGAHSSHQPAHPCGQGLGEGPDCGHTCRWQRVLLGSLSLSTLTLLLGDPGHALLLSAASVSSSVNQKSDGIYFLDRYKAVVLKCGPRTMNTTWELSRNANAWALPWT